jgi:hypothetical protein
VKAAPAANKKAWAVPGQSKKIALPTTSTNLMVLFYDPDGNITSLIDTNIRPSNATIVLHLLPVQMETCKRVPIPSANLIDNQVKGV